MFGFYEELLSTRFPHSSYKLVFVDQTYRDVSSYSTLGIFRSIYMYMLWLLNVCAHAHVCNDINALLMYICVCVCECTVQHLCSLLKHCFFSLQHQPPPLCQDHRPSTGDEEDHCQRHCRAVLWLLHLTPAMVSWVGE